MNNFSAISALVSRSARAARTSASRREIIGAAWLGVMRLSSRSPVAWSNSVLSTDASAATTPRHEISDRFTDRNKQERRCTVRNGTLDEAYARLHRYGPEWGENQLTNHGPMAVEVMIRRGYARQADHWVDRYLRRLDDLPTPLGPITDRDWPEAIGDGRRVMDWTAYFTRQLADASWRSVLATWWPRLLPGVLAGTTHGVIRVGHVVRALLAGDENPQTLDELAHGLAFWAARYR